MESKQNANSVTCSAFSGEKQGTLMYCSPIQRKLLLPNTEEVTAQQYRGSYCSAIQRKLQTQDRDTNCPDSASFLNTKYTHMPRSYHVKGQFLHGFCFWFTLWCQQRSSFSSHTYYKCTTYNSYQNLKLPNH